MGFGLANGELRYQAALGDQNAARILAQARADREAAIHAEYEAVRDRTWGEAAGDTGLALLKGAVSLGQAAYGVGNLVTVGGLDRGVGLSQNFKDTQDIINGWYSDPLRRDQQAASRAFDEQGTGAGVMAYLKNPALLATTAAENLPSLLPAAGMAARAGSAITNAAALAERASLITGALQSAGSTNVDTINAIREAGGTEAEAQAGGLKAGVVTGITTPVLSKLTGAAKLEALAANRLVGNKLASNAGASLVGSILKGGAKEGVEETLQSGAEQMAQNAFVPGADLTKGVKQAMGVGGVMGVLLGAPMGGMSHTPTPPVKATPQMREGADALNALAKELGVSPATAPVFALHPDAAPQEAPVVAPPVEVVGHNPDQQTLPFDTAPLSADAADAQMAARVKMAYAMADKDQQLPLPLFEGSVRPEFNPVQTPAPAPIEVRGYNPAQGVLGFDRPSFDALSVDNIMRRETLAPTADVQQVVDANTQTPPSGVKPVDLTDERVLRDYVQGGDGKWYKKAAVEAGDPNVQGVSFTAARAETAAAMPTWEKVLEGLAGGATKSSFRSATARKMLSALSERAQATGGEADKQVLWDFLEEHSSADLPSVFDKARVALESSAPAQSAPVQTDAALELPAVETPVQTAVEPDQKPAEPDQKPTEPDQPPVNPVVSDLVAAAESVTSPDARYYKLRGALKKFVQTEKNLDAIHEAYGEFQNTDVYKALTPAQRTRLGDLYRSATLEDDGNADTPPATPVAETPPAELGDYAPTAGNAVMEEATAQAAFELGAQTTKGGLQKVLTALGRQGLLSTAEVKRLRAQSLGASATDLRTAIQTALGLPQADTNSAPVEAPATPQATQKQEQPYDAMGRIVAPRTGANDADAMLFAAAETVDDSAVAPEERAAVKARVEHHETTAAQRDALNIGPGIAESVSKAVSGLETDFPTSDGNLPAITHGKPGDADYFSLVATSELDTTDLAGGANAMLFGHSSYLREDGSTKPYKMAIVVEKDGNKKVVGWMEVELDSTTNQVEAIHDIDILRSARKGGLGTSIIKALLADRDGAIRAVEQVPSATSFWDRMGVQNDYSDSDATHGKLQWGHLVEAGNARSDQGTGGTSVGTQQATAPESLGAGTSQGTGTEVSTDGLAVSDASDEDTALFNTLFGGAPKNSRAGKKTDTTLEPEKAAELVATANQMTGKDNIVLLPTVADAKALFPNAPDDVRGIYQGGKVYLVNENLASKEDLATVLVHERGHNSLEELLGEDKAAAVTNRLFANAAIRERIRAKMKAESLDRATAGEEVLMEMLENGERLTGDVLSKLRSGVNSMADSVLGLKGISVTDKHVDTLLDALKTARAGSEFKGALADDARYAAVDKLLRAPDTVTKMPRFSRANAALEEAVRGALLNTGADNSDDNHISKKVSGVVSEVYNGLKELYKGNSLAGVVRSFSQLDHMEAFYRGEFDTTRMTTNGVTEKYNPLTAVYDAVRGKSALADRLVSAPTEGIPGVVDDISGFYGNKLYGHTPITRKVVTRDVANRWAALPEKVRRDMDALTQFASYYGVFPDKPLEAQPPMSESVTAYTPEDRVEAHGFLSALWNRLPQAARDVYIDRSIDLNAKARLQAEVVRSELSESSGLAKDSPEFREKFGNRLDEIITVAGNTPYSSLSRYGDYFVTIRDADGSVPWFSGVSTKAEAEAVQAQLLSQMDPEARSVVSISKRQEFSPPLDSINQAKKDALIESIDALAGLDTDRRNELKGALVEVFLDSLPDSAFMQHNRKRNLTAGFSMDAHRAYCDYALKVSRNIANWKFDGDISRGLSDMEQVARERAEGKRDSSGALVVDEQGNPVNTGTGDRTKMDGIIRDVRAQIAAYKTRDTNSPMAKAATVVNKANFAMMMTSPATALTNAMQTGLVFVPRLAAQKLGNGVVGMVATGKALKEAMGLYMRSGADLRGARAQVPEDIRNIMDTLGAERVLDPAETSSLIDSAQGRVFTPSNRAGTAIMDTMTWMMRHSETFNRQVSAYTAAKVALDSGMDKAAALDFTRRMINESQYNYDPAVAPRAMQGAWGRIFLQFQKYRLSSLAFLARDIRDATRLLGKDITPEQKEAGQTALRVLAYQIGTQAALLGAKGTLVAPIAFALMDAFRDDDDLVDSSTKFSQGTSQLVAHGILGGFIDPSRANAGSVLPIIGGREYRPREATAKENAAWYLTQAAGPTWGLITDGWDGIEGAFTGDWKRANKLSPRAIRGLMDAWRESDTGATTSKGAQYYDPDALDSIATAAGFRTADRQRAEDTRSAGYQATARAKAVTQNYVNLYVAGELTGDQSLIDEANEKIAAWNEAHPDMKIKRSSMARAVKAVKKTESNAAKYGITAPGKLKKSIIEATGEQNE